MEVIGECPSRAKAKHRKASPLGESATDDEARFPLEWLGVLVTGWIQNLVLLTHGDLPGSAMSGSP